MLDIPVPAQSNLCMNTYSGREVIPYSAFLIPVTFADPGERIFGQRWMQVLCVEI